VNCKSIDNRVSVFILLETLRELKKTPYDVYGVFTVQEEVGLRGASVAAHHMSPISASDWIPLLLSMCLGRSRTSRLPVLEKEQE
jgi:hypothetical protein